MTSQKPLKRLGLTGSIGAGKSTVAALLRARGLTVLDADEQARTVTQEPGVVQEIAATFPGMVEGGVLNRPALAAWVFARPAELEKLNAIVHPRVRARMADLEAQAVAGGATWVVQDVPLLFENGLDASMDAVLVVDAPLELRVARVQARSGLTREDILARDARQVPAQEKRARADAVIENVGTLPDLEAQLDAALKKLGVGAPAPEG